MLAQNSNSVGAGDAPGDLEVYELLCVPVLAIDTGFNVIFINEKACEVTGYSKKDVRNKKLFDVAGAGELKKRLLRTFQGVAFERDFTLRGTLLTRNGQIRNVEWQCRTMHQGLLRAGAVITFVDRTGADTVAETARIIAEVRDLETMAGRFMDLLSDPLNLKLASICLRPAGGAPITYQRAYPSGGMRKSPRHALRDGRQMQGQTEVRRFPLEAGGRPFGELELTAYGGSGLAAEDDVYIGQLCGLISTGIARLLPPDNPGRDRERAEEAAAEAEKEKKDSASQDILKCLLSILPHGIITCSADGRVLTASETVEHILGLGSDEIIGQKIAEIGHRLGPARKNGTAMTVRHMAAHRALRTGHPVTGVRSTIVVDGSKRVLSASAMPVRDAGGNVTGCLVTIRDTTVPDSIVRLGRVARGSASIDDLAEESLEIIINAAWLRLASLYLWDGQELKLVVLKGDHRGMPFPACREEPDPQSPTIPSRTFLRGEPVLIKDYRRCASIRLFDPLARTRPIRSIVGIPLAADQGVIGVLLAATGDRHPLDRDTVADLAAMCGHLASGLERIVPR